MKIVVIGGTGLIGARLVEKLRSSNHKVIAASRETGVNTQTGEGVNLAVMGADVVVDVSNATSFEDDAVTEFFERSTINLLEAEICADVKHHIVLSVVGADHLRKSAYMRAKIAQENLIKDSGIPYTILRSTQFFELADRIAQISTIGDEVHISGVAFQPIAADEVVAALANIASSPARNSTEEIAGPELMPMYEFMRYHLSQKEDSRRLIEDDHAQYYGVELTDESLTPGENAHLGNIRYEKWFQAQLLTV